MDSGRAATRRPGMTESDSISHALHRDLVAQRLPDRELELVEFRGHPHLIIARTRQRDVEDFLRIARPPGHDQYAIGEIDCLIDLMRHEQNRLAGLLPDA